MLGFGPWDFLGSIWILDLGFPLCIISAERRQPIRASLGAMLASLKSPGLVITNPLRSGDGGASREIMMSVVLLMSIELSLYAPPLPPLSGPWLRCGRGMGAPAGTTNVNHQRQRLYIVRFNQFHI